MRVLATFVVCSFKIMNEDEDEEEEKKNVN